MGNSHTFYSEKRSQLEQNKYIGAQSWRCAEHRDSQLLLLGPAMMRILWFPIAFMVFAIKVSDAIWSIIASKLQSIAAQGAVMLLELTSGLTGVHATLRGSTIDLDYGQLNPPTPMGVAEACAGMRMLMAFLALGVALAFLLNAFTVVF